MRTKDDAWMQSIHESIDQLSEILDSIPKMGLPHRTMMSIYATRRWHICLKSAEGHWASIAVTEHCLTMFSVAKSCTNEVRLSKRWNGSTTASIWWMAADKPIYILEGVKFTACPIFICFKIIVPLWIETRTAYKWVVNVRTLLYAVYLSLSTFSSVVHFRCRLHF